MDEAKLISLEDLQRVDSEINMTTLRHEQSLKKHSALNPDALNSLNSTLDATINLLTRIKHEINYSITPPTHDSLSDLFTHMTSILGHSKGLSKPFAGAHSWQQWVETSESFRAMYLAYERGLDAMFGATLSDGGREQLNRQASQVSQIEQMMAAIPVMLDCIQPLQPNLQLPVNFKRGLSVELDDDEQVIRFITVGALKQYSSNLRDGTSFAWYAQIKGVGDNKSAAFRSYMQELPTRCIVTLAWKFLDAIDESHESRQRAAQGASGACFIIDALKRKL